MQLKARIARRSGADMRLSQAMLGTFSKFFPLPQGGQKHLLKLAAHSAKLTLRNVRSAALLRKTSRRRSRSQLTSPALAQVAASLLSRVKLCDVSDRAIGRRPRANGTGYASIAVHSTTTLDSSALWAHHFFF